MPGGKGKRGNSTGSAVSLSPAQRRYLMRGLTQAGGKLPLFDEHGQEVDVRTIRSCIRAGLAEPWFANPLKPDWLVCKLTEKGRTALVKPGSDRQ